MTDLTYCYLHMTEAEIDSLDHLDDPDYWEYGLSDEELQIPVYMIPPDPDDNDSLPSNVHVSYPYGDPTKLTHPAAQANRMIDPNSRTLYDDTLGTGGVRGSSSIIGSGNGGYMAGIGGFGGVPANAGMVWKDLALDLLLPVDPVKEEAARAAKARRLANGVQQAEGNHEDEDQDHDLDNDDDLTRDTERDIEQDLDGDIEPDEEEDGDSSNGSLEGSMAPEETFDGDADADADADHEQEPELELEHDLDDDLTEELEEDLTEELEEEETQDIELEEELSDD